MPTSPLHNVVHNRRTCPVAILDGGMGTSLSKLGLPESIAWTAAFRLDDDEVKQAVYDAYLGFLNAGVDILTANTYNVSANFVRDVLSADALYAGKVEDAHSNENFLANPRQFATTCLEQNIRLAAQAIEYFMESAEPNASRPLLAASMGCYGTCIPGRAETANREALNPMRTPGYGVTIAELERYHRERIITAIDITNDDGTPLVDVLAFETVPDLLEAQAIVNVLETLQKEQRLARPIDSWVTFTCPDSSTVDNGDSFSRCVAALCSCELITGIGINCTAPELAVSLIQTAKRTIAESGSPKLIVCYPNSGEQYLARELKPGETEHWRSCAGQGDRSFSEMAQQWQREGCHIIGGCCRITADDIRLLNDQFSRG